MRDTAGSAATPRPDAENFDGEVSFEPPFTSFDHLFGAREQRKRCGDAERPCTLATRALASWRPARRQMDRPPFTQPLTILPRIVLMSACVNARSVCVRTFPRAPLLNPSAVMEISSGASTIATTSYSPSRLIQSDCRV